MPTEIKEKPDWHIIHQKLFGEDYRQTELEVGHQVARRARELMRDLSHAIANDFPQNAKKRITIGERWAIDITIRPMQNDNRD